MSSVPPGARLASPAHLRSGLVVLTDRAQVPPGRSLIDVVAELAAGIAGLTVVVREKDLPAEQRTAVVGALVPIVHRAGGTLLVASDPVLADAVGADGVHLAAADAWPSERPPIVGRSCHGIDDVRVAAAEGCDHVFVSPVFETPSKPGYGPALGPDGLAAVVTRLRSEGVAVPVVALGGITPERAAACLAAGAAAVAVMGSAMRDPGRWAEACRVAPGDLTGSGSRPLPDAEEVVA